MKKKPGLKQFPAIKTISNAGHKTILGPTAQGWFCVLRWNEFLICGRNCNIVIEWGS